MGLKIEIPHNNDVVEVEIERSCRCIAPRPCGTKVTAESMRSWLLNRVIDFMETEEAAG